MIKKEQRGHVLQLTLNRPEVFNSFNRTMALALQEALDAADDDDSVRCIVLTAEGKAFCAGQDLGEAIADDGPSLETILSEHYNPIVTRLRSIEKPIIAAVNGVAAGAGANLALACDIVLASSQASFIQAFSKIGLIPDSAGTYFLPRLIGMQKALALMMTGDKVSAEEAERMGMIYKVFEAEQFADEVEKMAQKLSQMPTYALGLCKRAMNQSLTHNLVDQLQVELDLQVMAGESHDFNEGVAAFLEKRKPVFKGN